MRIETSFLIKVDRGLAIFVTAYEVTFLGHLIAGCLKEIDQFGAHADINGCQVVFIAIETVQIRAPGKIKRRKLVFRAVKMI